MSLGLETRCSELLDETIGTPRQYCLSSSLRAQLLCKHPSEDWRSLKEVVDAYQIPKGAVGTGLHLDHS